MIHSYRKILTHCALGVGLCVPGVWAQDRVTAADAPKLETSLESNPDDPAARSKLLTFYQRSGDEKSRKARLRHLEWLVSHHPDSNLFTKDLTRLTPDDFKGLDAEKAAILKAWREQMKAHPDEEVVFENALRSLNQVDYDVSIEALKGLRRLEPTNPRWAYLMSALYEGAFTKPDLAPKAQADLMESKDLPVVGITGQDLYVMGKSGKAEPLAQYGEQLLKRAQAMDPISPRWSTANAAKGAPMTEKDLWPYGKVPPIKVPEGAVRVAAATQAAKLIHKDDPVCTPMPQAPCPEGRTVLRLDVVIGKEGRVKTLHAMSGQIQLIPVAMDAVRQWTWKPTLVNGQAVEVVTQVDAVFAGTKSLSAAPAKPAGGKIQPPVPIKRVDPEFTPEASKAGYNGTVLVSLTVDEKGIPHDVKVARAAGMGLDERAVTAVSQWTFKPAMQDGKAVAVPATVEVTFKSGK